MDSSGIHPITIAAPDGERRALWQYLPKARAACILAHGAATHADHPLLELLAGALTGAEIASLRYDFRRGVQPKILSRHADYLPVTHAVFRRALELGPELPWFAAGHSFGARVTLLAALEGHLPGCKGLLLFGFPLHPPGKPERARIELLRQSPLPTLLLSGDRDAHALPDLLARATSPNLSLAWLSGADHSYRHSKRAKQSLQDQMSRQIGLWVRSQY